VKGIYQASVGVLKVTFAVSGSVASILSIP